MAIYKVGDMCQLPTYSQANEVQMVITYSDGPNATVAVP